MFAAFQFERLGLTFHLLNQGQFFQQFFICQMTSSSCFYSFFIFALLYYNSNLSEGKQILVKFQQKKANFI